MKEARKDLGGDLEFCRLEPPYDGIYRPFLDAVAISLDQEVHIL